MQGPVFLQPINIGPIRVEQKGLYLTWPGL